MYYLSISLMRGERKLIQAELKMFYEHLRSFMSQGYDNKIIPNDDGLVYADLAFSDHQPRSRAPIIDPYR